ncbi:hypothetical protein Acr_00g0007310 [Actinidia rufa]|uniref:Integrase catalytic domain-containing protein n=1 Tax=Actinidia rufa TaxID=165716 RepID=A0A7J0D8C1_9ERIC|nr:hypothetical protein Acr_00g0007310 [Actinidia rufa]
MLSSPSPQRGESGELHVDFTDLNKACPKDSFPLPKIVLIVDVTSKHELLSFMNTFSGYPQIKMYPPDVDKTSFITERGFYYYKVMPFELKNVGVTYQRLFNKMFKKMTRKTMEVYIDDMLDLFSKPYQASIWSMLYASGSKSQTMKLNMNLYSCRLRVAIELGVEFLDTFNGSQLVIKYFKIRQIPREKNRKADALANLASAFDFILDRNGTLPSNKLRALWIQYRSAKFCLLYGTLYKRSFLGPLLKCLRLEEAEYVLREIHEGICRNHSGARSLVTKAIRQGYFWLQMEQDAVSFTRKCDKCQRFALVSHLPHIEMVLMTSQWSFAQRGVDILGPLPQAPLQRKFLIVATNYFTKWLEAELLAKITEKNTRNFIWRNIICQFEIPKIIIFDNTKQFDNDGLKLFCSDLANSTFLLARSSQSEQSSGSNQHNDLEKSEGEIRKIQRRMDRRSIEHNMGLPHHEQNPYGRDAVLYGVWNKISYPSGNWNTELQEFNFGQEEQ